MHRSSTVCVESRVAFIDDSNTWITVGSSKLLQVLSPGHLVSVGGYLSVHSLHGGLEVVQL